MIKIGYYYYLQNSSYNFTPTRLNAIEDNFLLFENLLREEKIKIQGENYREVTIEKVHLDRIGFENERFGEVYCCAIYKLLGNDLGNLASRFFGYYVFHKGDLTEIQQMKNLLENTVSEKYKEDPDYLYSLEEMRKEFNTIFTINELFQKLNDLNIEIENKDEVVTGLNI